MGELAAAVESFGRWLDEDDRRGPVTLNAECTLSGGTALDVTVGRRTVTVDEPTSLGGTGTGPSPVAYLLVSIASCEAIGLSYWSDLLDVRYDTVQVLVEGDINLGGAYDLVDATAAFSEVRVEIRIAGSEPAERYEELVERADRHSPLLETLRRPVAVTVALDVNPTDGDASV